MSEDELNLTVQTVYEPEQIRACQADLERLLPEWLSLESQEQQWRLQRFVHQLTRQPQLVPTFRAVLQQRIQKHNAQVQKQPGIELLKDLKLMLDLSV